MTATSKWKCICHQLLLDHQTYVFLSFIKVWTEGWNVAFIDVMDKNKSFECRGPLVRYNSHLHQKITTIIPKYWLQDSTWLLSFCSTEFSGYELFARVAYFFWRISFFNWQHSTDFFWKFLKMHDNFQHQVIY